MFRTSCVNGAEKSKKTVLNIGGIFPILGKGGWQGGQGKEFFSKFTRFSHPLLIYLNFFDLLTPN